MLCVLREKEMLVMMSKQKKTTASPPSKEGKARTQQSSVLHSKFSSGAAIFITAQRIIVYEKHALILCMKFRRRITTSIWNNKMCSQQHKRSKERRGR